MNHIELPIEKHKKLDILNTRHTHYITPITRYNHGNATTKYQVTVL